MKNLFTLAADCKYVLNNVLMFVVFLLVALRLPAQSLHPSVFAENDFLYSRTDFGIIDTLDKWTYTLDLTYKDTTGDSVKPIGQIEFNRTIALPDSISRALYGTGWTPVMNFEIYNVRDADFCRRKANRTRVISNCVPPSAGGDMFIVGRFVFLNPSPCVNCYKYDTNLDYCRPLIKYVFSKVDETHAETIDDIVKQFPIKGSGKKKK